MNIKNQYIQLLRSRTRNSLANFVVSKINLNRHISIKIIKINTSNYNNYKILIKILTIKTLSVPRISAFS